MARNKWKKRVKRMVFIVTGAYLLILLFIYFFQEKIMFFPRSLPQNHVYAFEQHFEELQLLPEENVNINALHFKTENPKGVVLYFHGNAGNLQRWGTIAEYFVTLQYDVFIMDYRGYGKSKGKRSEASFLSDAQYCYDYIAKHYDSKAITVYGRSLGTNFATYVASKNPVKQLILEAPFLNFSDMAARRFPMFPTHQLLKYKMPSDQYIKKVRSPITIFHGTKDRVVPYDAGKLLYECASNPKNTFISIKNGGHNNLATFDSYQKELIKRL